MLYSVKLTRHSRGAENEDGNKWEEDGLWLSHFLEGRRRRIAHMDGNKCRSRQAESNQRGRYENSRRSYDNVHTSRYGVASAYGTFVAKTSNVVVTDSSHSVAE